MNPLIENFLNYMTNAKGAGENTLLAYRRDLCKLENYLSAAGGASIESATTTALMAFVLHLHKNGKHASTISRNIAVIKNFYKHLFYNRTISHDPAHTLKPPKIVRATAPTLSVCDQDKLFGDSGPSDTSTKALRDRSIVVLIFSTGIKASILTELNLDDIDITAGLLRHKHNREFNTIKLTPVVLDLLTAYINFSRNEILSASKTLELSNTIAPLFVNMKGQRLTRQGLWKIIKAYGRQAELDLELNPRLLSGSNT